jgi:hypothetical protein
MVFQRVLVLVRSLVCLAALFAAEARPPPGSAAALLQQIHFESKLWPNLHHFLYVVARARNGAPDRFRVAVRAAPLDTEGFGALPAGDRKRWDEAIEAYQTNAAPWISATGNWWTSTTPLPIWLPRRTFMKRRIFLTRSAAR